MSRNKEGATRHTFIKKTFLLFFSTEKNKSITCKRIASSVHKEKFFKLKKGVLEPDFFDTWEALHKADVDEALTESIDILKKISKTQDQGVTIVKQGDEVKLLSKEGKEIGKIVDEYDAIIDEGILPTKFLGNVDNLENLGDIGNGYDLVKQGDNIAFKARLKADYDGYGQSIVKLENGIEVGSGEIVGDFMTAQISTKLRGVRIAKGSNVFDKLYDSVIKNAGNLKVKGFKGVWMDGLPDNLNTFNELIITKVNKGLMTIEEAAFSTFTGRMAKRKGFDKVIDIQGKKNSDGTYQYVTGIFFSN